jgi:cytochrome P450
MVATVSLAPLFDPEKRVDPYPFYAMLHTLGPVSRVDADVPDLKLVANGYEAAGRVLRDPVFRVVDQYTLPTPPTWEENPTRSVFFNSVMFNNEPRHGRMRRMVNQVFTARRVAELDPAITTITTNLLERMADKSAQGIPVDYIADFAYPLPSNVLGELMGVPESDRGWYRPLAAAVGVIMELGAATPDNVRAADAASVQLVEYFTRLADERRANPRNDLISALVHAAQAEDAQLSTEELMANLIVLFNAGFVTTTHLLGNGLTLLLDRPALVDALRAHPDRAAAYVEEILRFEVPTHFVIRWAAQDTELAGVPVREGERVLVLLAAANRDPQRFPDPDTFDPSRSDNVTLSFGSGAHFCLGAALARLEGQRGLTMLFDRFTDVALAERPPTPRQLMLRGYDMLWVKLR